MMATVTVDRRGAQLEHHSGALVIRIAGERPQSIPLRLIDRLVIAASVQLDSNLLTHLAENDVGLLALPARGHRRSAFLHCDSHGDSARRLAQYQMAISEESALNWARGFVVCRLLGSRRLLRRALDNRADQRRPLSRGIAQLSESITAARAASSLESLRGLEGAGTAHYLAAYKTLFTPTLGFRQRNRRPPRDPVNAALSLSYTLAHSDAVQALARAGLDPMLGFLHQPVHNRESLACDLVELSRPRIEQLVWRLFADKQLTDQHFTLEDRGARMSKAARRIFFPAYETHAGVHRRAFRRCAQALARACERLPSGRYA